MALLLEKLIRIWRQEAALRVREYLREFTSPADRILPLNLFMQEASKALSLTKQVSENDLVAILVFLVRDEGALLFRDNVSGTTT